MENMSSNCLLIEPGGPLFPISPPIFCSGGCGGQFGMMGAIEGPGYASWAIVAHDFSTPGVCGPNLACIASNNWDFLSHNLFLRDTSGVRAFILWCVIRWQGSFIRPYTVHVREGLCVSGVCCLLVLPGVCLLAPRLPIAGRA